VNQTSNEKLPGTKFVSVKAFLDCNPVILRIVEENSTADESKFRMFFEAEHNRM
jgi:hypothetical protein